MRQSVRTYILVIILFLAFITIRAFQDTLFYDPFIAYFKSNFLSKEFPDFNTIKLIASLLFRYVLNAMISLAILYLLFRTKGIVKVSTGIFIVAFLVLCPIYFTLLYLNDVGEYMLLFYIRRFLIHPVFILILIPAFYYQKKKQKVV
ncbi:exosortase F system-associated protein [Neptunitalea chrysea]|uniref:Exosortase F system-associated protein n=1 Tax=Neptunitalea chrysea TaxID=1647581 RepID=A0A9W6B684_9FLAO|nr:exosortase F system-associated protein [Neptunitalea chrysea]GLB51463.1 exosortase F system-associated protein [Neptunitalea chrysea]